jgi:hypothetical protein
LKKIWPKIVLLLLCCAALAVELRHSRKTSIPAPPLPTAVTQKKKPDFVLLPESEVTAYARLFGDPKLHLESWEPALGDIDDLNSNLSQISALSNKESDPNRRIDAPDQYFRQYLAAVENGKKIIFVNALCSVAQPPNLRKQLILGADGGKCFWHATYDPATQTFSDLIVNGSL